MPKKLLMGNEAFAHAALAAGASVIAGYPGTPSSEVIETVAARVASGGAHDVHVEWSTNEKAALEMLAGASYAGARTLFTCKQVGLNVAADPLMSLNYVGVEGGCVLYVADDPGPISSQTEQDTRRFASFAKVPVFDPENIEQGMDMMAAAFELSEAYRTPVIVRPTTRVCHSSTYVDVPDETYGRPARGFTKDDSRWVIFPARSYRGHLEIVERLARIAEDFSDARGLGRFNPVEHHGESARLGIVCGGVSTAYTREALAILAAMHSDALPAYRFMQIGTPYPFPANLVDSFVDGLDEIIVFEELDHVIEDELCALMGRRAMDGRAVARVRGKRTGDTQMAGENLVDNVLSQLERMLGFAPDAADGVAAAADAAMAAAADRAGTETAEKRDLPDIEVPVRPPVLCAGCPHRGAFYAAKRAARRRKVVFSGDIGCYTLGNAKPLDAIDTCLCMGAGITMAQGLKVAEPDAKQIAFIGDSTFFASGMTGVANAVYNAHDIVICVLDNRTTAMTGDQPHPGTGDTLMGTKSDPLDVEAVLSALGVRMIEHANPHCLDESIDAVKRSLDFAGPSAVIFEAPCVNLIRPASACIVDQDACTKCRRCITAIGCPAIGFMDDRIMIDETICMGCGQCVQVCPYGAMTVPDGMPVEVRTGKEAHA